MAAKVKVFDFDTGLQYKIEMIRFVATKTKVLTYTN